MEPRFGYEFSEVRIHPDSAAAASAARLGARAYTVGRDIVFADGEYAPGTVEGRTLLAHELAHVVQQGGGSGGSRDADRSPAAFDVEADRLGERVARDNAVASPLSSAPISLQREPAPASAQPVEEEHAKAQRVLYSYMRRVNYPEAPKRTIWGDVRGDPKPPPLTPEEKAVDPHVLFNNSLQWITTGRLKLCILSPDPANAKNGFDPSVYYPDVGGTVTNTIPLERGGDAWTDVTKATIYMLGRSDMTKDRFQELIRHEVQHAASAGGTPGADASDAAAFANEPGADPVHAEMNATIWQKYQTEFRAHWLESIARPGRQYAVNASGQPVTTGGSGNVDKYGSEFEPGGEVRVKGTQGQPEVVEQLDNEKQTNIANRIIHNYFGMEETFLASPLFRTKVRALTSAEGVNLVNSRRIERLSDAIHKRTTVWRRKASQGEEIAEAVRWLDETDLAFLKSTRAQPFWDDAQSTLDAELFAWLRKSVQLGMANAPLPSSDATKR